MSDSAEDFKLLPKPGIDAIRDALRLHAPAFAELEIEPLSEGWDFFAFNAGDYVLRVPKIRHALASIVNERRLMPSLAPALPLPVSVPDLYVPHGPNGLPFIGHRRVEGVQLRDLGRTPAPGFGAALGRFLRALQAFPIERAVELGLGCIAASTARERLIQDYERDARRIFPLLSCETRTFVERTVETYVNDPASFAYVSCLSHADIDDRNVCADPVTGELTGVIDFGDARIGDPAEDATWAYCGGFAMLGIADQLPDLLREAGIDESRLAGRITFMPVWWALDNINHALDIGRDDFVEEELRT